MEDIARPRKKYIDLKLLENEIDNALLRDIFEEHENRYKNLIENIQEYIYSVAYTDGVFTSTYHSDKSLEVTGYTPKEYDQNPYLWFSMIHEEDRGLVNAFLNSVISNHKTETIEHRIIIKSGLVRWVSNTCSAVIDKNGNLAHLNGFILDITKRKRAEMRMELAVRVLDVLNKLSGVTDVIREIVQLVKNYLGIEAVGIRLFQNGDYSYDVTMGFPEYFVAAENSLWQYDVKGNPVLDHCNKPTLDCLCGIVINKQIDHDNAYFTPHGSFWTNSTSDPEFAPAISGLNAHMRNRCIIEGYESIALIPLQSEDRTIGLFQMNDRRKGLFTLETIEFFEGVGASIGIALSRRIAEKALQASEEKLRQRNEAIENDLKLAQLVQSRFIANGIIPSDKIKIEYRYLPHDLVGGDYFSITPLHEGGLGIFIGDVVGHGISAALFLSLLKAVTDRVCRNHGLAPRTYLYQLNNELFDYLDMNFITAIYGMFIFDGADKGSRFIFSNGGHPMPIHMLCHERKTRFINAEGTIIGAFPDMQYEEKEIYLKPGDRLFLYTDGIPEVKNEQGQIMGFDEMSHIILDSYRSSLGDMLDCILERVNEHRGRNAIDDDIVLIGFEVI